jgi:hypothetical protein
MAKRNRFNPQEVGGFDISVERLLLTFKDRFIVSPFSVLNAREGAWQDRKNAWLQLGIKSELGRGENALKFSKTVSSDFHKFQAGMLTQDEKAKALLYNTESIKTHPDASLQQKRNQLLYGDLASVHDIKAEHAAVSVDQKKKNMLRQDMAGEITGETDTLRTGKMQRKKGYLTYGVDSTNKILNQPKVKPGPATAFVAQDGLNKLMEQRRQNAANDPNAKPENNLKGTSIFDPVLCELAYSWWCPPGGTILDPFAGGSVRGIVASMLGYQYTGVELSENQVLANMAQWVDMDAKGITRGAKAPTWINGDSSNIRSLTRGHVEPGGADFLFSCPPYGNLEVYSDDPKDISSMSYEGFLESYRSIIKRSCSLLKNNRFACFVVGDFRDKDTGMLRGFIDDTNAAFKDAGLRLYNDAVLITAVGSLAVRTSSFFSKYRKLGRTHQMVLCYYKGDDFKEVRPLFE